MIDERVKQRIRLHLRGEEAMGLHSLPIRLQAMETVAAAAAVLAAPTPAPRAAPMPPPAPARSVPVAAEAVGRASALFVEEEGPFTSPVLSTEEKRRALAELNEQSVKGCRKCELGRHRTQTVFGEGDVDASIFFIGEGPGETEDRTGRPFVGRAGQKLDEMIAAMGLQREQVFIANIVKCRPPGNRVPAPDEVDACTPYLLRQLEVVRPRVIVTLGLPATRYMLKSNLSMSRLRGNWHTWRGIKLMPTFHPSYILRVYTLETRKAVWSDLQKVMQELGLTNSKNSPAAQE